MLVFIRGDPKDKTSVCARGTVFSPRPSVFSSRFPQARFSAVLFFLVQIMPWNRKTCWMEDAWCRLDSSIAPQYGSERELASPETHAPHMESREDDKQFSPHSLLQEISTHNPCKGFFTTGQAFKGIFCMDQTGFACACAAAEFAILPVLELAAFPPCSACWRLRSGEPASPSWPQCFLTNSAGSHT